jgi:hypothetical protein
MKQQSGFASNLLASIYRKAFMNHSEGHLVSLYREAPTAL